MARSYSNDIRKEVIESVQEGSTYKEVSRRFKLSLSAVGKWYKRYKEEGVYEQKNRGGSARKIDLEKLERCTESNPDMKLKEAAEEFKVSIFTISYWLRELGYSYKKKTFSYVEASKEKRDKYLEEIRSITTAELVFLDESGIDMSICRDRG